MYRKHTAVWLLVIFVLTLSLASLATGAEKSAGDEQYVEYTQGQLSSDREKLNGTKVLVKGSFLFTGSDFCYQIRKTKINTRDYLCFALGPLNLMRFYLKKDHPQVKELMGVKKGAKLSAYGTYDSLGNDYKFIVVDRFEMVNGK